MIVRAIDSSSIAKFVNREDNWEAAAEALRAGCVSIDLAVKETGNSLWKRVHRGQLDSKRAKQIFAEFIGSLPFKVADQARLYRPAFDIATSFSITVYDALFLALSREEGLQFVTSDPSQAEVAKKLGVEVQYIP